MVSVAHVVAIEASSVSERVVASLESAGFRVTWVEDDEAAIAAISAGNGVDLVLLGASEFDARAARLRAAVRAGTEPPAFLPVSDSQPTSAPDRHNDGASEAIALVEAVKDAVAAALSRTRARTPPFDGDTALCASQGSAAKPAIPSTDRPSTEDPSSDLASRVTHALLRLSPSERGDETAIRRAVSEAVDGARKLGGHAIAAPNEVLTGDLASISLAEVLQLLEMQQQTGVLCVSNPRVTIALWIHRGRLHLARARRPPSEFKLGRYLIERDLITREEIEAILPTLPRKTGARRLGEALVSTGKITSADLMAALKRQSSELVYEALRWPSGRFGFSKEPFSPEADETKLDLKIQGLLLEGFRRIDEWRRIEGSIHFDAILGPGERAADATASLTRTDRRVLASVNGARTVRDVIKQSSVSTFDGVQSIYRLIEARFVSIEFA